MSEPQSLIQAREVVIGDQAKLGNRWHRVTKVEHYEPPTEEDVTRCYEAVVAARDYSELRLYEAVVAARDYSELRLYEAVRDLHAALSSRQRSPEPYVQIWGGSATTYWHKRYSPTQEIKVKR